MRVAAATTSAMANGNGNGDKVKSLMSMNVNMGTLITALGPAGLIVWQGMAWASDIEFQVKKNADQLETLIVAAEKREAKRAEERTEENKATLALLEKLDRMIEQNDEHHNGE